MASVLELFNCKKLWAIHAFISSRHVVSVDDDGGDGDRGAEGGGTVLKYSWVSSA